MIKHLFCIFVVVLGLLSWSGCERSINESTEKNGIRLDLKQVDQPSRPTLFAPHMNTRLAKSTRLVTEQVVLLHCDETSGTELLDASRYGNNGVLYNVTRFDSSATTALKKALDFQRVNSYAMLQVHDELNASYGFNIQLRFYVKEPFQQTEQRLLDRQDANGGYTIGLFSGRLFLRVKQTGKVIEVASTTTLTSKRWYSLEAYFSSGKLGFKIDGKLDRETDFSGPITASTRQTLLGAGWSDYYIAYQFWGRMDEVSISTTVEYEDFDALRVVVFDLSKFASSDSFYRSATWRNYQTTYHDMMEDTTRVPTWNEWRQLWSKTLDIASESVLSIDGGFARGTVRGVEGLNMIAIGGIQKNELTYYGFGFAIVVQGKQVTDADMEVWKAGVD
jgi:hypothetical protein